MRNTWEQGSAEASDSYLDLIRAPYVLYGVKYTGLVSLAPVSLDRVIAVHLGLNHTPICVAWG